MINLIILWSRCHKFSNLIFFTRSRDFFSTLLFQQIWSYSWLYSKFFIFSVSVWSCIQLVKVNLFFFLRLLKHDVLLNISTLTHFGNLFLFLNFVLAFFQVQMNDMDFGVLIRVFRVFICVIKNASVFCTKVSGMKFHLIRSRLSRVGERVCFTESSFFSEADSCPSMVN